MAKIRVFTKRPRPLDDLNVVVINNFIIPFDIDLYQQIDDDEPELVQKSRFIPAEKPDILPTPPDVIPPIVEKDLDLNGVERIPLPKGLKYDNESYKPKENFRADGSRLDFADRVRNAGCIGGYLKTKTSINGEEFAGKTLGTHSSSDANSGTYTIGITVEGDRARLRKEVHNNYSESITPTTIKVGNLKNKFVGIQIQKINLDNSKVMMRAFVDTDPFDSNGKPKNNWVKVFEETDTGNFDKSKKGDLTLDQLKKVWLVPSISGKSQYTLRVDKEASDPNVEYKYVFCREILGEAIVPPEPEPSPNPEPEPEPPKPAQGLDENGMKMLHPVTGKYKEITEGNDHRNGQRYSKNHQFLNYMVQGYFQLGEGQDVMEHKTDGVNHGGCNEAGGAGKDFPIEDCCWVEVNISLKDRKGYKAGQFYISSEHPHPENFDAPKEGIGKKIFNIKPKQWIGYAACAWQEGEFRHLQGWVDTNPFDSSGKPLNNWELGIDLVDTGFLTTPKLAKRKIPIDHVKDKSKGMIGLESEIRMNNATKGDCKIKFARIYELVTPVT